MTSGLFHLWDFVWFSSRGGFIHESFDLDEKVLGNVKKRVGGHICVKTRKVSENVKSCRKRKISLKLQNIAENSKYCIILQIFANIDQNLKKIGLDCKKTAPDCENYVEIAKKRVGDALIDKKHARGSLFHAPSSVCNAL